MYKICTLISFLFFCYTVCAQVEGASLVSIQACGGATLIGNPVWGNGTIHPATLYFEKQVGTNWVTINTQPSVNGNNFIIITPGDISSATSYRLRVLDENTAQEFISPGVIVNPATWNGTLPFSNSITTSCNWGAFSCGAEDDYLLVEPGILPGGRPPYKIEYRKATDADFTIASEATLWTAIYGIVPDATYTVRVTDFCGRIATQSGLRLRMDVDTYVIQPTTCSNGVIRLSRSGTVAHRGIAPFTYAIGKYTDTMTTIRPVLHFGTDSAFNNLAPGDYDVQLKDACGNTSAIQFIRLGGGLPRLSVINQQLSADSCSFTATVTRFTGTYPLSYGIMAPGQTQFVYQDDSVFTNLSVAGTYFFKLKDQCGDSSLTGTIVLNFPQATVDSVKILPGSSNCMKDFTILASNGPGPYEYAIRPRNSGSFVYQSSATFRNIPQALYDVSIKDRCGRLSAIFPLDLTDPACSLRTITGDFEVAGAQGCSDMNGNAWIDAKDTLGNIIFSINPQGNNLQQVCWGVRITDGMGSDLRKSTINGTLTHFLDRNFYIEPTPIPVLNQNVLLRLYITDAEINNMIWYLQNNGSPAVTIADLKILKKTGSPGSPVDLEVINENITPPAQFAIIQPIIKKFGINNWYIEFSIFSFSELMPFIGNLSVLPLDFIALNARKQNQDVLLEWTTANESNTKYFEIEWSDHPGNFSSIGKISSNNTPVTNSYHFMHLNAPTGNNFYRIKQIDIDGKYTYSKIVSLQIEASSVIQIYPNPTQNSVQVRLRSNNETVKYIQLSNMAGSILFTQNTIYSSNANISLSSLPTGVYWLKVVTGKNVHVIKVLKQ
ncbi:MAG: T9SS type A sorting domain-containing protein [Agriterribacter sp.]